MFGIVHSVPGSRRGLYAHNFRSREEAQSYIDQRIHREHNPVIVPLPNYLETDA